ncbi:PREDICTED: acyl-CoA desaturase [Ceratosolen solmsi marchali]|uniref:Acyl-CoA desaturase n=1 Tax=Ceratosolen solmsi marchali TaxID=326594 RepID=A0AAJ7DWG1_9HYME|nr:PREDICTED: acyl-CoA desaturase [Ceratosolen solmsi marchali]
MAPNIVNGEVNLTKEDTNTSILEAPKITEQATIVKPEEVKQIEETKGSWFLLDKNIIWKNVIFIFLFHAIAAYGFLTLPYIQRWKTFLWATFIGVIAAFGITGGIHRFWTHKAYKANMPLRVILMICYVAAGQNSIYNWVRDHRVHHKFSETDADPHNSKRGFFFSHVGWLMLRKHPEVLRKGKQIDMSDIRMDPVAAFCERLVPCNSISDL